MGGAHGPARGGFQAVRRGLGLWRAGPRIKGFPMSRYDGEGILVIPRALFDELGAFEGLSTETGRYLPALMDPSNNFFMDREAAEDDPGHKQLIPYSLIHHRGRLLHYTRGATGGEARLHARGSIGIGGHINPVDAREGHRGRATYLAGVTREIEEELVIEGEHPQRIVALLNDDRDSVGRVHLGLVHLFDLSGPGVTAREEGLANLRFRTVEELRGPLYSDLESWSRFCVDRIEDLLGRSV